LPASGKMHLTNPGKPGLVGEGSTPRARQRFSLSTSG
jgi:hypothetical protein